MRRTRWRYDEIVLACDLVASNGWQALDRRIDKRVADLSHLLRSMSPEPSAADPTFRNADGVDRKTHDVATLHPDYPGKPTKGGRLTVEVVAEFLAEPSRVLQYAAEVRSKGLAGRLREGSSHGCS